MTAVITINGKDAIFTDLNNKGVSSISIGKQTYNTLLRVIKSKFNAYSIENLKEKFKGTNEYRCKYCVEMKMSIVDSSVEFAKPGDHSEKAMYFSYDEWENITEQLKNMEEMR